MYIVNCKKLYQNSSLKRLIRFKGLEIIDKDHTVISELFQAIVKRFNLLSFRDILLNSVADQHIILPDKDKTKKIIYPEWIKDHITAGNRGDKSNGNITTALDYGFNDIYDIQSIETLYINQDKSKIDLGPISRLPNLQRLSVRCEDPFKLGQHTTLKSLELFTDAHYEIRDLKLTKLINVPQRDTFSTLKSLVELKIDMYPLEMELEDDELSKLQFIDLDGLPNLETFKYQEFYDYSVDYSIEISLPPSLKILHLIYDHIQIPSHTTIVGGIVCESTETNIQ
ncbi:hypothetical protein DFA_02401 [Cavenderia fasciculata]|uniref:Uncharacterized protein n=1 Tax=Cavenderia fasciculata TaxID=261658 RepID=F4PZC5_CACFS|nr:uncharacterized protein DFA_02401 [Cavenderia fasciculata]EGG19154.1 hypothetical protein DFA_02401 [Cavenderia fasciculata]|eukprot:XP_004366787.1 hypothetical protein DFA_02401 [Cavenderia fasciculata]